MHWLWSMNYSDVGVFLTFWFCSTRDQSDQKNNKALWQISLKCMKDHVRLDFAKSRNILDKQKKEKTQLVNLIPD